MNPKKYYTKSEFSESWLQNGIIYQNISPHVAKIDLNIAQQLVADRVHASGSSKVNLPVLCYVNNAINVKREANLYYRKPDSYLGISAIAMIMDNYTARIVGDLIFKIRKPIVPIAFFNSEEKAIKWLSAFKSVE